MSEGQIPRDDSNYVRSPARMGLANKSFVLGIAGLLTAVVGIGVVLGFIGVILGIVAVVKIHRDPSRYAGKGFAIAGIVMGMVAALVVVPLVAGVLHVRELARRTGCAENFRDLGSMINVYASENGDQYPVLPYVPYSARNAGTSVVAGPSGSSAEDTIKWIYGSHAQDGSPLAGMWLMVLQGNSWAKMFLCPSDVWATGPAEKMAGGAYYTNFQNDGQISYSFAYPWVMGNGGAEVAPWWRATMDGDIPLAADMAPLNGTGNPVRNVCPGSVPRSNKIWNSGNHQGAGQNVMFGDGHVDFANSPNTWVSPDNIYSTGRAGGATEFGGTQPVKMPILIPKPTGKPYDIYMVPTRNLDTGGL